MNKIVDFFKRCPIDMFFLVFLYISQLYYSYRYIFKVNSTTTSPTYADTSFSEKIIKYILTLVLFLLIIACLFLVQKYKARIKEVIASRKYLLGYLVIFFVYIFVDMLAVHGISTTLLKSSVAYDYLFKFIIFVPFVLIPLFLDKELLKKYWMQFLYFSFIFQAFYTLVEQLLYTFFNRLPALAYAGGTIRFGGAWDDPNGVSLFYILFIIFLIFYESKLPAWLRYLLLATAVYLLFLALSFTSLFLLIIICIIAAVKKHTTYGLVLFGIVFVMFLFEILTPSGFQSAVITKIPSAEQHIYAITGIKLPEKKIQTGNGTTVPAVAYPAQATSPRVSLVSRLFGEKQPVFSEDFYTQYYKNFGFIGLGMLCVLFGYAVKKIVQDARASIDDGFTFSAFLFVILTIIGSIGIPFLQVFPVNVYFWICFGIVMVYGLEAV